ncbi:hypothetical protein SK128_023990 [Halocaridina rubra]|uniref:Nck-associated protein 5 n=1 Tax=Halocaridina rubra TaxID=373956 RepID=A0AAN8WIA9_HALRR
MKVYGYSAPSMFPTVPSRVSTASNENEVKSINNLGPKGPYQPNGNLQHFNLNDSYNHNKMDVTEKLPDSKKVEELRMENEEVKSRLSTLQQEFSQLENQVRVLLAERQEVENRLKSEQEAQEIAYANKLMQYQATVAALDQCTTPLIEDAPGHEVLAEDSQSQASISNNNFLQRLLHRCKTLEEANTRLQVEARAQQQQYEICLDRVATQVVQALLSQKSHQEQCIKLAHQVQDLRRQNAALSSLVGYSRGPQTLPCSHRHRCPLPSSPPSFFSLPSSLTKNRQQNNAWPAGGWLASWHVEESSQRSSLQVLNENNIPQSREGNRSPQDGSSSVTTQTATCWYDIVTSLGRACPSATGTSKLNDPSTGEGWTSSIKCQRTRESDGAVCVSPPCGSDTPNSKFSPLSLESATTSASSSPEQRGYQVFQAKIDNLTFEKSKISHKKELLEGTTNDNNTNVIINNLSKEQISDILKVKGEILRSLAPSANIDASVLSCDEKNKSALNRNLIKVNINKSGISENGEETGEGATRDEGYSTMSSDVQAEVKEGITTSSVTTVQEEPLITSAGTECSNYEVTSNGENLIGKDQIKSKCNSIDRTSDTLNVDSLKPQGSNNNESTCLETNLDSNECLSRKGSKKSDSLDRAVGHEKKVSVAPNAEYCDGLRVIYDEDDNNSDVFFIPIQEPENQSLYRHSYHVPMSTESQKPTRWHSDSQLYVGSNQPSKLARSLDRHVSQKDLAERTASTEEVLEEACNTRSLKRSAAQASLKRRSKTLMKEECTTSGSSEELWPLEEHHRKYLSPSYSHAELEDWSLDLSSEYLSGPCGEGEGSESAGTTGAHQGSLPSIQEATPDLEEDHNEFLWNGATYFKADLDLNWSSKKELTKSWQMDHSKEIQTVMSPRSGCSDQPAVWSSSEQLSCCSEGISKCSSDFENFCEQICNLPELKRVSFCSSEAGGQGASKAATPDTSSLEGHEEEELVDEINIDTVFTRDFYRLVKFESSKSLAASSRSLATGDGMLTLEKLQDLETGGRHKEALASVLGFIAEQQKYCKEREAEDERDTSQPNERLGSCFENAVGCRGTFPKMALRESCNEQRKIFENYCMKTLPPFLVKQNSVDSSFLKGSHTPAKCSNSYVKSDVNVDDVCPNYVSARYPSSVTHPPNFPSASLPVSPATTLPEPFVPSRSTSLAYPQVIIPACGVEAPTPLVPKVPVRSASDHPGTNCMVEAYGVEPQLHIMQEVIHPQSLQIPEHHYSAVCSLPPECFPPVPKRSSSMAFPCNVLPVPEHKVDLTESPPVPKRITSRALPKPPSLSVDTPEPRRPKSFIRETAGPKRLSLQELQHMARVEEEEKRTTQSSGTGQEAVSPGDAAGLGTSWVRVQPHIDLQDPQARATLLDGMIESSEGCSSETEEEEGVPNQYSQLRSMHRSRRKRKGLGQAQCGGGRIILAPTSAPRPSVIGREDIFVRFGEKERAALQAFEFLGDISTSYSDLGSQDLLGACGGVSIEKSQKKNTTISSLSGRDGNAFSGRRIEKYVNNKDLKLNCRTSRITKACEAQGKSLNNEVSNINRILSQSEVSQGERSASNENCVDTRSISSVKATIRQLNKNNQISGMKQPANITPVPARCASSTGKVSTPTSTNKNRPWNYSRSKSSTDGISGCARSKVNIRHGNSPSSRTPSPQLRGKDSKFTSGNTGSGVTNLGDKTSCTLGKVSEKSQGGSTSKSGSPTRIPRIQASLVSSKKLQSDPQKSVAGEDCVKDPCSESPKRSKSQCERALPPKGFSFRAVKPSPRIRTSASVQQRLILRTQQQQQQQPLVQHSLGRSPRLGRLRKNDPLDSFSGKSLGDSGSSEGSELCGGRLSLSDSCAENFSPIDSGEEVFEKEC